MDRPDKTFRGSQAAELITRLELIPHPEGGWYRETWRSTISIDGRSAGSSIFFLLESGQRSQWHQVDADEFWLWHAGHALELGIASADRTVGERTILGPDVTAGDMPQMLVPAGHWQTTNAGSGWALVSCLVVPAFNFEGFKLATPHLAEELDAVVRASGPGYE
jgi:predicted cupin superfamily sugar epimerase